MSHGPTSSRYETNSEEVEEPLRAISPKTVQPPPLYGAALVAIARPFLASWPVLVLGLLVGGAVAAWQQSTAPIVYTAEALVAPNRTRTEVQFVPQIKTVDDSTTQTQTGLTPERRQALVDLVRSSSVEDQVISDLTGKLPAPELQRGEIVQHISGAIRPRSEILSIQATAPSSTDAIAIANSWANNYVDQVNRIYSTSGDDNSVIQLRDQAQQTLSDAEAALSESIKTSPLESLDRRIADDQALLTLLESPTAQTSTTQSSSANGSGPQASNSSNPQNTSVAGTNDYRVAARRTLDDLAQTLRRIDVTRQTVQALLGEAQTTGSLSASDAAALAILKTQLVTISDGLPAQVQVQLPANTGGSVEELQALSDNLDTVRQQVATTFDARRTEYEQQNAQQIGQIEQELQQLRAQREAADAERKRLTDQRDMASDTYTALAKKAEERRVADSASGREVELASEATYADQLPRRSTAGVAQAGLVGLLVAGVIALARWYLIRRRDSLRVSRYLPNVRARTRTTTPV